MGINYFWDSYAIIEFLHGNKNYEKFRNKSIAISVLNLAEIYYSFLSEYSEKEANELYERYKNFVVKFGDDILKQAMQFRKENKKRKLSYADCIGYCLSKQLGIKFLTGDKQFENLDNVEYVK
jgi:uncharacterized protein